MFKFLNRRRKKGQSTLEYAILVIVVLAALLSIQVYIKRGLQGGLKSSGDQMGDQFSPGNTNVIKRVRTNSITSETFLSGVQRSELLNDEITITEVNSQIIVQNQEFWGKAGN